MSLSSLSSLHKAAMYGNLEIVKERFNFASSFEQMYALFFASKHNHLEVVKFLVSQGIKPNAHGSLLVAAASGNLEIFKFLVNSGACISDNNYKALFNAVNNRRDDIVKYILDREQVTKGKNMSWVLEGFAEKGKFDEVKYLISLGINTEDVDLTKIFR